jgi:response regulator of citrate/malate metabolism
MDGNVSPGDSLLHVQPENPSVLSVDDDTLLQKLFSRSIRKLMPSWKIEESGRGGKSMRLVDEETFDLICMDQYTVHDISVDKQLLGKDTVRALRAKGAKSRICGLSANEKDMETSFLRSAAKRKVFFEISEL